MIEKHGFLTISRRNKSSFKTSLSIRKEIIRRSLKTPSQFSGTAKFWSDRVDVLSQAEKTCSNKNMRFSPHPSACIKQTFAVWDITKNINFHYLPKPRDATSVANRIGAFPLLNSKQEKKQLVKRPRDATSIANRIRTFLLLNSKQETKKLIKKLLLNVTLSSTFLSTSPYWKFSMIVTPSLGNRKGNAGANNFSFYSLNFSFIFSGKCCK